MISSISIMSKGNDDSLQRNFTYFRFNSRKTRKPRRGS